MNDLFWGCSFLVFSYMRLFVVDMTMDKLAKAQ